MPANIVNSFAKKTGKSKKEIESYFKKATKIAADMGMKNRYDYITDILKNMLGIEESITDLFIKSKKNFNEFYEEVTSGSLGSDLPENPPTGEFKKRKKKDNEEDEEDEEALHKKIKIGSNK